MFEEIDRAAQRYRTIGVRSLLLIGGLMLVLPSASSAQDPRKAEKYAEKCYQRAEPKACDDLYEIAARESALHFGATKEPMMPRGIREIESHSDRPGMVRVAANTQDAEVRKDLVLKLLPALTTDELTVLLKGIPDFASFRNDQGRTPLFFAVTQDHRDTIALLLANKADINSADNDGWTPLIDAADQGTVPAAQLLVAAGADVNRADNSLGMPLAHAAAKGRTAMVNWLLANNAQVDGRSKNGATPLFWAVQGHPDIVSILLAHKADVDARGADGSPVLDYAAASGDVESAKAPSGRGGKHQLCVGCGWNPVVECRLFRARRDGSISDNKRSRPPGKKQGRCHGHSQRSVIGERRNIEGLDRIGGRRQCP